MLNSITLSNRELIRDHSASQEYFGGKSGHGPILRALTFVILYNVLIPLSLYVSLDLIRTALARSIEADPRINWDGLPGGCPAQALTANLVSDLGQVDYLFSDKTGTLTENRMELVRMSCKGDLFGGPHAVEPPQGLCALIIPGKHIFSPLRIFF